MSWTIGEVSKKFDLPISTIRYYDRQGLFPDLVRESGIRKFTEKDLDALRVIECLKKSGLDLKQIAQFMDWCHQGADTYQDRLQLFINQKKEVERQRQELLKTEAMIDYKIWYYTNALADGNEDGVLEKTANKNLPADVVRAYCLSHEQPSEEPVLDSSGTKTV